MSQLQMLPSRAAQGEMTKYFREVNETALLDAHEEHEVAEQIQLGDREARDHLVRANLRLVIRIAREFTNKGICLQDLIQEGSLGLMRAVEGFDPTMGTRFSTYAGYWIRQSIQRALENQSTSIRVPSYAVDLVINWRRTTTRLLEQLGRTPTEEEVAVELKLTKKQLQIARKALRIYNATSATGETDSAALSLGEALTDHGNTAPDAIMVAQDEKTQVLQLIDTLDPRAATVLRLRFGLTGESPLTFQEIGDRLDLTRERVRQIERDSLKKLKQQM